MVLYYRTLEKILFTDLFIESMSRGKRAGKGRENLSAEPDTGLDPMTWIS